MKAKDIIKALANRHGADDVATVGKEWAFFEELRAGTGYGTYDYSKKEKELNNPEQRLDAFAINLYPSKKNERVVYEIKVSRGDFLDEIKNPRKRQQGLALSNSFYFVTPVGLVSVEEVPEECGLIEVAEDLKCRVVKKAPYREVADPPLQFLCSIARRGCKAEKNIVELKQKNKEKELKMMPSKTKVGPKPREIVDGRS